MKYDYDVAVLGGGSAGYAAARTTAGAGLKTVVIEGGQEVGGLCILRGCMPSKALLYAAEVRHLAQHGATWGLKPGRIEFDFKKVMARKATMIENFVSYRRKQLESGKFKFIRANACFVDAHTLELKSLNAGTAGSLLPAAKLTAKYFIIATGSVVSPSPLAALDEV